MDYNALLPLIQSKIPHQYILRTPSLVENLLVIEDLIGKPLPKELIDFYSFSDGIEIEMRTSQNGKWNLGGQGIPPLATVFADFKNVSEEFDLDSCYEEPFYESIWTEDLLENLSEEQQQFIRRQKIFLFINGTSSNITIDFFDAEKPYQLYFQPNGDIEFYPLQITVEQFYTIFLQVEVAGYWFAHFMSIEDRQKAGFQNWSWKETLEVYPEFDMSTLEP
ncbi:MAG: hypothetical protein FGM14_13690 [Flavobacteriales bacterium]|nr:hypothetical protein [Flavobacteriales bacterium]